MEFGSSSGSRPAERVNQGPVDNSILFRQSEHRSWFVYNDDKLCNQNMDCRRSEGAIWQWLDDASLGTNHIIEQYGFGPICRVGLILYDHALITSLVERWRPETHKFHLPIGEATITLQDVEVLLGLNVDGDPITGFRMSEHGWEGECEEKLGLTPHGNDVDNGHLKLTALLRHIWTFPVPDHYPVEMHHQRARCFIMYLLGGLLLADSTRSRVPLFLMQFITNPETCRRFSWGSIVLACLYRNLCTAALSKSSVPSNGCLLLVQRVRTVRPRIWVASIRFPTLVVH